MVARSPAARAAANQCAREHPASTAAPTVVPYATGQSGAPLLTGSRSVTWRSLLLFAGRPAAGACGYAAVANWPTVRLNVMSSIDRGPLGPPGARAPSLRGPCRLE